MCVYFNVMDVCLCYSNVYMLIKLKCIYVCDIVYLWNSKFNIYVWG